MNRLISVIRHIAYPLLITAALGLLTSCVQTPSGSSTAENRANQSAWVGGYQGQTTNAKGKSTPISLWLSAQGAYRLVLGGWGGQPAQIFTGRTQIEASSTLNLIGAPKSLAHWQQIKPEANHTQIATADHSLTLTQTPALVGVLALPDEWMLTDLPGTPIDADQKPPYLRFSLSQQVAGFDGCNRLMGGYMLEGNHGLHFKPLAGTLMACQGNPIETPFRHMLTQVAKATIDGETLSFHNAAGEVIAQFRAESSQALPSPSRKNSASRPE